MPEIDNLPIEIVYEILEFIPLEIRQKIKEYLPIDKNMFSPTSLCIKHVIDDYNDSRNNDNYWLNPNFKKYFPSFPSFYFSLYRYN